MTAEALQATQSCPSQEAHPDRDDRLPHPNDVTISNVAKNALHDLSKITLFFSGLTLCSFLFGAFNYENPISLFNYSRLSTKRDLAALNQARVMECRNYCNELEILLARTHMSAESMQKEMELIRLWKRAYPECLEVQETPTVSNRTLGKRIDQRADERISQEAVRKRPEHCKEFDASMKSSRRSLDYHTSQNNLHKQLYKKHGKNLSKLHCMTGGFCKERLGWGNYQI